MLIQENTSLKKMNTFNIDVSAKYFCVYNQPDQIEEVLSFASQKKMPLLILGGGSNLLFTKNYEGLVVKNELKGIECIAEDESFVYLKASAGESWHQFVLYCIDHQYGGVENLALIPGMVGATPMQNIGAYGVEIKDVFHELEAYHLQDKKKVIFSKQDCMFGYRESIFKNKFKNKFIITSVTYKLSKKPQFNIAYGAIQQELEKKGVTTLTVNEIAQAVIDIRKSKLPNPEKIGNAGSFFKNPLISAAAFESLKTTYPSITGFGGENGLVKIAAGWLIEQCGWKGFRKGNTGCYEHQALVLVNFGNASGEEIYQFSEDIIQSVYHKFDIVLEREVNIV